jgi:DNA polymerase III subunit beta
MKFTCGQKELASDIAFVMKAVASSSSHPILTTIKITATDGEVKVTAFDLSLAIESTLKADVETAGSVAIPAKVLNDIISRLYGEVTITETAYGGIKINSECGEYSIPGMDVTEYPELPSVTGDTNELSAIAFYNAIAKTNVSCSRDESRSLLSGIFTKVKDRQIECASTDGHRLIVSKTTSTPSSTDTFEVVIPAKTTEQLSKMLSGAEADDIINLKIESNSQLLFTFKNKSLITRTIEGKYPDYNLLIPRQFRRQLTVDRKELIEALSRTIVMSDNTKIVKFYLKPDKQSLLIVVNSQDIGNAEEYMDAKINGEEISLAFNSSYLMDGLKVLSSKDICFNINGPLEPVVLKEVEGTEVIYLAMPVQLRE